MIELTVHDDERQHFSVAGDEPFRVEVMVTDGRVLAEVYPGHITDMEQDPIGCYDGSNGPPHGNTPWTWTDPSDDPHDTDGNRLTPA